MQAEVWTKNGRAGSSRIIAWFPAMALSFGLFACTKAPEPGREPVARVSAPAGQSAAPSAAASAPAAGNAAAPVTGPGGPPPGRAREIRAYFRSATSPETVRLWTGPFDAKGWERLTQLSAWIDGKPVYSMAASTIRFAGICRSAGRGFDQMLLSFNREPHGKGGAGIVWYDPAAHRFVQAFLKEDITQDPDGHLHCAAGRSILPEGVPAQPCLCPWADSPEGGGGTAAAGIAGLPESRTGGEILISTEMPEPEPARGDPAGESSRETGRPGWTGAGPGTTGGKTSPAAHLPIEVEEYARALADVNAGKGTLEALLQAGQRAKQSLVPTESSTPLEEMSEEELAAVKRMMGGYLVGREATLYVEPEPAALLAIAKGHGDAADVAYFETLSRTTDGVWPVYAEQSGDFGTCTRYGSKELVAAYRQWNDYAARFPGRYADEVEREIKQAAGQLTEGNCACDDAQSVLAELTAFVEQFPAAPIAPIVVERIADLKSGKSSFHFKCSPG